ncbi:glycolipid 2-alpha-mannosyltransferase [Eremomyces bilateralis CBS 781.70]|uniref:Glycolipid 2-alpha-mannosyltransferase n=1 Tax=Eremomyces bilateralis CBS 781.70 TaxID=1392243 RepID=A0A6G1G2G8_9PEZI|nr:glycolipid 2-alpha-mannosyltransferase [Eremomyces bilateralis CBS 781.70]KAF1812182.1 glycolipid 2-alpha-mannosyltransferase [Eremomyces bilateralis CBS 781.70]
MVVPRPIRLLTLISAFLFLWLVYQIFKSDLPHGSPPKEEKITNWVKDPNLDPTDEPPEPLRRVIGNNYAPNNPDSSRVNATLMALVRNNEIDAMLQSMRDLERTWNSKFNYPWLFLNDEPFTDEFKEKTSAATRAEVRYELVPKEHWDMPSWINRDLYDESVEVLKAQGVQYMDRFSYHQMCRWNSGFFYKHPALLSTKYYWRVEPNVRFFCDVDYDVFGWMQDHNKTYGYTINLYDSPESVAGLWPATEKFLAVHKEHLHPNNAIQWLTDKEGRPENFEKAHGYSTCHFWSNFEIGDMDFWRSEAYEKYFNHLDRAGGFWYERWGDAPVHSIALGLFEDKSKIHWFRDIGYQHVPFLHCPNSSKCRGCETGKFTDGESFLQKEDCRAVYFKHVGMH